MPKNTFAFSLKGCLGVMDAHGMGENAMLTVLHDLKDRRQIRDGYVLQTDLQSAMDRLQG